MTGAIGGREKVDAALSGSLNRLLGQVEMEKAEFSLHTLPYISFQISPSDNNHEQPLKACRDGIVIYSWLNRIKQQKKYLKSYDMHLPVFLLHSKAYEWDTAKQL